MLYANSMYWQHQACILIQDLLCSFQNPINSFWICLTLRHGQNSISDKVTLLITEEQYTHQQ